MYVNERGTNVLRVKEMKKMIRERVIKDYKARVEKMQTKNDQRDIMIEISKKCSAYNLTWEEFMEIRELVKVKSRELRISFGF